MNIHNQVAELLYRKCPEVFSRYGDDYVMDLITVKSQGQTSVANVCKKVLAALKQEVSESRIMDRNAKINAYYIASTGKKHKVAEGIPYYLLDKLVSGLTKKYNITMNDIEVRPADQSQYRRSSQPDLAETALQGQDDLDAKRQALQQMEREPGHNKEAIRQRKLDLEKEAHAKNLNEFNPDIAEGVASDDRPEHQLHTELVYNHGADKIKLQYERDGDTNKLINNIQKIAKLQHGMDIDVDTAEWIAGDLVYPDILEQGLEESPEEALKYATNAHAGQTRSGGDPYITHPMRVADHIRQYKQSHNLDALISAAYLHDTIEDTDTTQEVLHDLFGGLVASLVKELTSDPEQIKKMGKAQYLSHKMAVMSSYGLVIKLADRLDNVKDITTARTPEWRAKYAKETNQILDYIEKTRALSGTHKKLISLIRAKLAEIDNPPQSVDEAAGTLGLRTWSGQVKLAHGKDVKFYNRKNDTIDRVVAMNGQKLVGIFDRATDKGRVIDEGISRRGILKGIAGAGALGAAGKASAIAGAFPTPSHQAAMYKAAADSNRAQARADAAAKAKADAERLQKNTDQVDKEQRVNHHKLDEFAPGNGDDGIPHAEYVVYQCDPSDQFEFIGGPLYQTDNLGMAHKYAYEKYVKHRPKAFVIYQPHAEASRGNYGVKGQSDHTEDDMTESSDYLDEK